MFTGIIESVGEIIEIGVEGSNRHFKIKSEISNQLRVDQSVSHEGVCLTVTSLGTHEHWVTAIEETLQKSNLRSWTVGKKINLERCMKADGRFDGHIVQGHVDSTAEVQRITEKDGSWVFGFKVDKNTLMVEKGSVCINGASLTCFDVSSLGFNVAIIPFTYEHTTFSSLEVGSLANIEFDIIGKYVQKIMNT